MSLLETVEITTDDHPQAAVIWMHGLGADGNDFVPIVRELDLSDCPAIRFVFPHAETIPVTINNGYVMRAWYDILGMDLVRREDEVGLRKSQQQIEQLIAREIERGIPAERIILAGFSQGCAMTLQTGLRFPKNSLVCYVSPVIFRSQTNFLQSAAQLIVLHPFLWRMVGWIR